MRARSLVRGLGVPCRGCLGGLDDHAEAGLCGRCWSGLLPLPEGRCPRCALRHDGEAECPEPVGWAQGDALWDYHGGRPALGALLLPGIKAGEWGWRRALLARVDAAPLPPWAPQADLVTAAPTFWWRDLRRGGDFARDFAGRVAERLGRPFEALLGKSWRAPGQTGRPESARRRLPRKAVSLRRGVEVGGRTVLLVDDVWTTGTTLLRCAQALEAGGAARVLVLAAFRAL
jgi:predicted amidophosphoribosyltransferase